MGSTHLRGQTPESLALLWPDLTLTPSVARRVIERIVGRGHDDLDGVEGLSPRTARSILERAPISRLAVLDRRVSAVDGFAKYLFRAADGASFEAVRIPLERPRWSVCVSSQAGCALGCSFCETGRLGLERSLEAWEIVEQVLRIRADAPERPVTSVVFQGQGEPLQNYDAVLRAAAILRDPNGLRIRGESITISTVGLVPAMNRLTDEGHVFRLVVSLTSAIQEKRETLVPLARVHSVEEVALAARRHAERLGGPVHVGWVLIAGFNTGEDEANALARLFEGVPARVHLIDVHDPAGGLAPPSDAERGAFLAALRARGIAFVRRYSGGADIHGACGMLASTMRGGTSLGGARETPAGPGS
jgi:23S rRNA (adenine2503-C2)-methyltransferase